MKINSYDSNASVFFSSGISGEWKPKNTGPNIFNVYFLELTWFLPLSPSTGTDSKVRKQMLRVGVGRLVSVTCDHVEKSFLWGLWYLWTISQCWELAAQHLYKHGVRAGGDTSVYSTCLMSPRHWVWFLVPGKISK